MLYLRHIALGYRTLAAQVAARTAVVEAGYTANNPAPTGPGATYVLDDEATSVELFHVPREMDGSLGFAPQPSHRRQPAWPATDIPPAAG